MDGDGIFLAHYGRLMVRFNSDLNTVLPFNRFLVAILADKGAFAMLLPSLPCADEFATISIRQGAFSVLEIINKLACVNATILPLKLSYSIHLVVPPLALVLSAVDPLAIAEAAFLIGLELTPKVDGLL